LSFRILKRSVARRSEAGRSQVSRALAELRHRSHQHVLWLLISKRGHYGGELTKNAAMLRRILVIYHSLLSARNPQSSQERLTASFFLSNNVFYML
jgi:hypothetical protein